MVKSSAKSGTLVGAALRGREKDKLPPVSPVAGPKSPAAPAKGAKGVAKKASAKDSAGKGKAKTPVGKKGGAKAAAAEAGEEAGGLVGKHPAARAAKAAAAARAAPPAAKSAPAAVVMRGGEVKAVRRAGGEEESGGGYVGPYTRIAQRIAAGERPEDIKDEVEDYSIRRAVGSMLAWLKKQQEKNKDKQLFEEDEVLNLVVTLKKVSLKKKTLPHMIELPHPMYTMEGQEICLFVKDKEGEGHKEAKKRIAESERCGVAKVLGVSKLRSNFKPYEAKRKLCASYDLFMADDRIIPVLPKLLGKTFFNKKRHPVPVNLRKGDWAAQIRKAASATHLYVTSGSCTMVRIGRASQGMEALCANLTKVVEVLKVKAPKGWKNVQALYLKSNESASLPIYASMPNDAMQALLSFRVEGKQQEAEA